MSSLTANVLPKATDGTHIEDSRISDDGTDIAGEVTNGGGVKFGDFNDENNGTFLVLNDTAKTVALRADDVGFTTSIDMAGGASGFISIVNGAGQAIALETTGKIRLTSLNNTVILVDGTARTITSSATNGIAQSAPASTTAGILSNGQISFYLDELGNTLKVAVKYSDGSTKTGTIALL